ncbi:MAG: tyrosine-type recombinase/integrase [Hyphomonas sp.]|nr:site-specific integrase [Hyphomonas sp.]MCC0017457.1 site-specific integrase [Rhodobiaceae bacterium]MCB9960854.1 site-specific integrase [Hyphomonas sp.]MCB9961727.1 site-specific integrase [Hyphomonas sp.]MCB9971797.1 site-specific integrase [Hyphomonas sp.]
MTSAPIPTFATLLQQFFTQRLMQQKRVSAHTIKSYRDTFRMLLRFAQDRLHTSPDRLTFEMIDAPFISAFLAEMEKTRGVSVRTRNLRLTAIRSFFRFAAYEMPTHSAQIQRVLAMPAKRHDRRLIDFLTRPEADALLGAPDKATWIGRRDHALLLTTLQTGMRLSEVTSLRRQDITFGTGAHIDIIGKGRKQRAIPLCKPVTAVLAAWFEETGAAPDSVVFPSMRGGQMSADAVERLLSKHLAIASETCASLKKKHITFHCLRHTTAMDLLHAGVEQTVIALWLGHESVETTQIYLDADLALKEKILARTIPFDSKPGKYRPDDRLLAFLSQL